MQFALFQYIVIIICGILGGFVSFYVFANNPKHAVNRSFALFGAGVTLWNLGMPLLFFSGDALFISMILEGGIILSIGLFYFGVSFPSGKISRRALWLLLPGVITAILIPTGIFISDFAITPAGYIVPHNEPIFALYALVAAFYMLGGTGLLVRRYLRSRGAVREQTKYFIIGTAFFSITSLVCDAILPGLSIFEFNLIGPVASLIFIITTGYSILRYKLMDMRFIEHLEQLVAERTEELKKLQEDQKQAMVDISHNLQTPLAIIRGQLELLRDSNIEPEKIETVKHSLDRVSSFVRQLLRLARLDHETSETRLSKLNLSALLLDQVDYFEVMAEERGVRITSEISKKEARILGNKKLLEELFNNIVANAITYKRDIQNSKVCITLKETPHQFIVEVGDNGIGIPASELPELFTRFYRTSAHQKNPHSTGLGLAISKKIVERHNGTISVKSILGEGTLFILSFPKPSA